MTGVRMIAALRTPVATLAVLVAALIAQLPHAADVFRLAVHADGIWATAHSYSYAIALELAVLMFVVQHRNVESYVFAVASICINLAYYYLHGVQLLSVEAAPAWLISVALPVAIARYSHLIVDAGAHEPAPEVTEPTVHDAEPIADVPQVHVAAPVQVQRTPAKRAIAKLTPGQRRLQIAESGIADAAVIAARYNVSLRTAHADLAATRSALITTNGATK